MFVKYTSIENTYREEFLDRIKGHGFWDMEYVVQEKTHGANLSYFTENGIGFKSAKRSGTLAADEKFHNHELILEELKPNFIRIWNKLKNKYAELNQLNIFGELIGGSYPHKSIKQDNKSIKVQKGIFYSPQNHFFAYDILINGDTYLSVGEANYFFEKENMLHAKTLFRGSLEDCLKYPNAFKSIVSADLGLPELENNTCEGVVIKPVTPCFFNNGVRVILKNKNERWSENTKFHKTIKKEEKLPEKVIKLQGAILTYVTENRLNNVVSKIGEITFQDFGRVLGLFNKDIIEDFFKDYHHITDDLEKKELKAVTKSFGRASANLLKQKMEERVKKQPTRTY